jgi:lipopolysaccharide/colanic/teichoic acid biosynthesis glycosyltransferase
MTFATAIRRALDVARILAIVLLLIYLPALVMIALIVVLTSPGPALINRVYRRTNGGTVDLWEFRTECWRQWETTKVGGYLLRSNMYRLPALINIIRGEIELGERVKPAVDWQP